MVRQARRIAAHKHWHGGYRHEDEGTKQKASVQPQTPKIECSRSNGPEKVGPREKQRRVEQLRQQHLEAESLAEYGPEKYRNSPQERERKVLQRDAASTHEA